MTVRGVLGAGGIAVFLVCLLLYTYYPAIPQSQLGWAALIGLGLPTYFFLEWLGEAILGATFFKQRSSVGRVLLAVPVAAILLAVAALLVWLVRRAVVTA